jgi:two-component system, response regulator YesN
MTPSQQTVFKVVIVEDEQLILDHLVTKINQFDLGFYVAGTAKNGRKALELISELQPSLVITDIRMPVMDGLELIKEITYRFPDIKKVIISGFSEFKYAQQAIQYGVKDYLLKPIEVNAFRKTLIELKILLSLETEALKHNLLKNIDTQQLSTEELLEKFQFYLRENYTQDINLEELSKSLNLNPTHLSRMFTKRFGENPSTYLINLRINKAKYLLENNPEMSVKDIAELVGYSDQNYFSHAFKKLTGISPAHYRAEKKANI